MQIQATPYLTWERAQIPHSVSEPRPVADALPSWWKALPGDLTNTVPTCPHRNILDEHGMKSAKFCLGLQGAKHLGWTVPLDQPVDSALMRPDKGPWQVFYQNVKDPSWPECESEADFALLPADVQHECLHVHGYVPSVTTHGRFAGRPRLVSMSWLHPEMVHGTPWTEKDQQGDYRWNMMLISWPWRAKLAENWRLMVMANQFDWDHQYHVFTGCVDGNYRPEHEAWSFDQPRDPGYNYVNLDIVVAVSAGHVIPESRCIFTAVPIYDPGYTPAQRRPKRADLRSRQKDPDST